MPSASSMPRRRDQLQISYHKSDSRHLGRPMEHKRYGHAGRPVIVFPTSRGRFYQYEDSGAVAALRESGRGWTELAQRFGVGANALHIPLRDPASAGVLSAAYQRFAATPMPQWSTMRLEGDEIVALVNVRVLAQSLGVEPDVVARRTGGMSFVDLYAQFLR